MVMNFHVCRPRSPQVRNLPQMPRKITKTCYTPEEDLTHNRFPLATPQRNDQRSACPSL